MPVFTITGLIDATFSGDRSGVEIGFRTDKDDVRLDMSAEHLDSLITHLQAIEYQASILDPATERLPRERTQMISEIVHHWKVENADFDSLPSVLLSLQSAHVTRWFAIDPAEAMGMAEAMKQEAAHIQA